MLHADRIVLTLAQVADLFQITEQEAAELVKGEEFPPPLLLLKKHRRWLRHDIVDHILHPPDGVFDGEEDQE